MEKSTRSRYSRIFSLEEAQVMLDEIPSDDGSITEEEDYSDAEDPSFSVDVIDRNKVEDYESETESEQPESVVPSVTATVGKKTESVKRCWKRRESVMKMDPFLLPEGPIADHFQSCSSPGDYFLKFFDLSLRNSIIYQTNLYATQQGRRFTPITDQELLGFIGINFVMGYHKLPSIADYWKADQDLCIPFVASTMPRFRFQQILSNLHVNDSKSIPTDNKDKLYKLRPLITHMNDCYAKLYNVSRHVSIDESMILFKGRHSIKQYNPKKPIKRGYKLWMRADMDGFISKFDVYQGKGTFGSESQSSKTFNLGERVVVDMTMDLLGKHHCVYFDNYFSSVTLMEYLKTNNVNACGTIRPDRKGLPKDMLVDKKLVRGQYDYRVSDQDITYYKWMDNKAVHIISNFHGTDDSVIKRTQKDGSKSEFSCPLAIKCYNQYMGGVDKADMLCSIHGLGRKSKKWWHRIFFGIMDRTLVNAQVAYKKIEGENISILNFRRSVAQALITLSRHGKVGRPQSTPPLVVQKRRKTEYTVDRDMRLQNRGAHWITFTKGKRGRCEVCSKKKIESRPHSKCSMCGVFLCSNERKNCFLEFHEIQ